MIWKNNPDLESLNGISKNTLVEHLGIKFIEIAEDYLVAKMPVDHRTKQPQGLLHGGASVALAETMGSVASVLTQENPFTPVVGVEINANHLSSAKEGYVYGKVKPLKLGKRLHVWEIKIEDENQKAICVSRLTVMILSNQ